VDDREIGEQKPIVTAITTLPTRNHAGLWTDSTIDGTMPFCSRELKSFCRTAWRLSCRHQQSDSLSCCGLPQFSIPSELARESQSMKTAALLMMALLLCPVAVADGKVEVVVGGMLRDEGGAWSPDAGPLTSPFGVDFAPNGDMWIVELEGGRVHRMEANGNVRHVGGDGTKSYRGDDGPLHGATFNGMHNCVVTRNGDLYIADSWNHCIRKVAANTGLITTVAGTGEKGFSGDGGPATAATFNFVMCIMLNPAQDRMLISDLNNRRVRRLDLQTGIVTTVAGNGSKGVPIDGSAAVDSPLVDPRAAVEDAEGGLWILERGGHALRVVRTDGTIHTIAGNGKSGFADGVGLAAQMGSPKHLCLDPQGNVYIADDQNGAIRRFDPKSQSVTTILGRGFGDAQIHLKNPHGVTWYDGWLYVVDMGHNRILRIRAEL
jgi:hypothetical protein